MVERDSMLHIIIKKGVTSLKDFAGKQDVMTMRRTGSIIVLVLALAVVFGGCDELNGTDEGNEEGTNSSPATPAVPAGITTGRIDSTYSFSTSATDPDTDAVSIRFDWGDGAMSEWSEFVASGTEVTATHAFTAAGTYQVKAMAKDGEGAQSDWSGTHQVTIEGLPGWHFVGTQSFSPGQVGELALEFHDGTPYVAFQDYVNGYGATVMYFDGSSWVNLGTPGFTSGGAYGLSFAIDGNGTPWVAYSDDSSLANVMKYNGSAWVQVGAAGFSEGAITSPSIAMYNTTPYVAYGDDYYADQGGYDHKAVVKMFNGTSWVLVGSAGFTGSEASSTSMAISSGGTPYVGFSDWAYANPFEFGKATVVKFDGSDWGAVGTAGFTAGEVRQTDLTLYGDQPYLAFRDASDGATVMTFTGSAWEPVGAETFSSGSIDFPSLTVVDGTPWISFKDNANESKCTVMQFDGASWVVCGEAGFSPDWIDFSSIAIEDGEPWVAFKDNQFQGSTAGLITVMVYR